MQFEMAFIPALLLAGSVYLLFAAELWKNEIKKVYSRRTKKEKILTAGTVAGMLLLMLLAAARCTKPAETAAGLPEWIQSALLWLFAGEVPVLALAVFLVCTLPVMVASAAVLDEISQKKPALALPFYFYLLLFFSEGLFYRPMAVSINTWFVLVLLSGMLYGLAKRQRGRLFYVMSALAFLLTVSEHGKPLFSVFAYLAFLTVNGAAAFLMNRASVLKKKYWYAVILLLYMLLFFAGRRF